MTLSDCMVPNTPQAERDALCSPRPVYVRVLIFDPSRRRDLREEFVVTLRAEEFDPEWNCPISYAHAAIEDDSALRTRLAEMADDEHRGCDWWATIHADGTVVFDGPASQCAEDIALGFTRYERTVVNP